LKEPLFKESHPAVKLVFLGAIWVVGIILLAGISVVFYDEDSVTTLKLLTAFQHIVLFVLPPVLAAYVFSKNVQRYLFLRKTKSVFILLTILIIFFSLPVINFTGFLNSQFTLPEALSGIEKIMKELEESAKQTTDTFLSVDSTGGLLVNIFVIALLPAIGEELLFRGVLIRLFNEWFKNIHLTIVITSFLFSFIHFQFYGFIPRMLLGMIFGYLMYWSGSIILPMIAHFLNNAVAVCIYYFFKDSDVYEKADTFGAGSSDFIWLLVSSVLLVLFFYILNKEGKEERLSVNLKQEG
jgi:membrane protease YdiL (CAAX protease family)